MTGFIGMELSYGLSLNVFLVFSAQYQCSVSNSIISVERLEQYMHIPSEAPEVIETNRPSTNWPADGKVEIFNLKVKIESIFNFYSRTDIYDYLHQMTSSRLDIGQMLH